MNQPIEINRCPTIQDPDGTYRQVDTEGRYWGHWYVGTDWTGQRFVAPADPRDGKPW